MKRFTAKLNANYFENITERDNFLEKYTIKIIPRRDGNQKDGNTKGKK